jgi:hypothetical protein
VIGEKLNKVFFSYLVLLKRAYDEQKGGIKIQVSLNPGSSWYKNHSLIKRLVTSGRPASRTTATAAS